LGNLVIDWVIANYPITQLPNYQIHSSLSRSFQRRFHSFSFHQRRTRSTAKMPTIISAMNRVDVTAG
jgi:hypothetical protein